MTDPYGIALQIWCYDKVDYGDGKAFVGIGVKLCDEEKQTVGMGKKLMGMGWGLGQFIYRVTV